MGALFGFGGEIGSGKSAAAALLHEVAEVPSEHLEFSGMVMPVADGWMRRVGLVDEVDPANLFDLREVTADLYGVQLSDEQLVALDHKALRPYLASRIGMPEAERAITVATKDDHRPLLQWLGQAYIDHVDPLFWDKAMDARMTSAQRSKELVTVGGVRHSQNAAAIRDRGGNIIQVVRPGNRHAHQDHISEQGLAPEDVDITVMNNQTLDKLRLAMANLWADSRPQRLEPSGGVRFKRYTARR